jgi:hypothetical protein
MCRRVKSPFEFNFNWVLDVGQLGFVDVEELFVFVEAEHAGEDIGRKNGALGVEVTDDTVVEAAGSLDLVFGVSQLGLEIQEVLASLQVRVGLSDGKIALQRSLELVLSLGGFGGTLGIQGGGAGFGDLFKDTFFVAGVAFHAINEVRDKIGTALQLDGDITPGFVRADVQTY